MTLRIYGDDPGNVVLFLEDNQWDSIECDAESYIVVSDISTSDDFDTFGNEHRIEKSEVSEVAIQ